MTAIEIIHKARLIKQAFRRGDITLDQYHKSMNVLRSHLK